MSLVSVDLTDYMRPLSIEGDADHRVLIIAWSDGHMSPMGYEWLRWRCPCSSCAGQSGKQGVLSFTRELAPRRKNLVDVHLVGRYGIAPVWEDGHHAGGNLPRVTDDELVPESQEPDEEAHDSSSP